MQTEHDVAAASNELADLRHQCSQEDMTNLNHRKDIEHQERLVAEQKDIQATNYTELTRLRDISFNLDKDLDAQKKRVDMLHAEVDNNEHRIASISDMLR